jgi:pimeloyl-ACP methyl ester carboxylesterase
VRVHVSDIPKTSTGPAVSAPRARRPRRRRNVAVAIGTATAALLALNTVVVSRQTAPATGDQLVRLDGGDVRVVQSGPIEAPALLLIHGYGASAAWWDPVVPTLADRYRVIRVDLLGHGKSEKPAAGYDIPAQGRRVGAVLDRLGVRQATVIGHSTGGYVATALAEQRPDLVAGLALVDTGPGREAYIGGNLVSRLLPVPVLGQVIWRLRSDSAIRRGLDSAITRDVDLPDEIIDDVLNYLDQRNVPDRLADLNVPTLVIFGAEDKRWRSASVADYRRVPGVRIELLPEVGHTPMLEDPQRTGQLLLTFATEIRR